MVDTLPKFDPTDDTSMAIQMFTKPLIDKKNKQGEGDGKKTTSETSFQFGGYVSINNSE